MLLNAVRPASAAADESHLQPVSSLDEAQPPLYVFPRSPTPHDDVLTSLPPHRYIAPRLHTYRGTTATFRAAVDDVMTLPDEATFVVEPLYSSTLACLVEKRKRVFAANQLSVICDVMPLPEEFVAHKL